MPHRPEPAPQPLTQMPSGEAARQSPVERWSALRAALVPIVGEAGFAALYQRCLHLTLAKHPWLSAVAEDDDTGLGFASLRQAMSRQPPAQAAAAQDALLERFLATLADLIGPSLVHRLLGPAASLPTNDPPEQDSRP